MRWMELTLTFTALLQSVGHGPSVPKAAYGALKVTFAIHEIIRAVIAFHVSISWQPSAPASLSLAPFFIVE